MTLQIPQNRRFFAGLILFYSLLVLACLSVRPLWTDEVLQLVGTRNSPSIKAMMDWIRINAGAVPLGYLTQRPFILAAGPSSFWARFPSLIFSVASCFLLAAICRGLKLSGVVTFLATAIFMISPSQIRYAMEARPYSESMFFGLLAALAIARAARAGGITAAIYVVLTSVAALYTQPYVIFSLAGVCIWYAFAEFREGNGKRAIVSPVSLAIAATAFLPWYLYASPEWHYRMRLTGVPDFHWSRALAMDVFKGISGGTFLSSAALLLLAAAAFFDERRITGLLAFVSVFAIAGPVLADSVQNYYFAGRQILYAIPALSILAAIGFRALGRTRRPVAILALAVFAGASIIHDVSFQIHSKEDWRAAASALAEITRSGYCIQPAVEPVRVSDMYTVFVPGLAPDACAALETVPKFAFVSDFSMDSAHIRAEQERFERMGFRPVKSIEVGGTTVTLEERPSSSDSRRRAAVDDAHADHA